MNSKIILLAIIIIAALLRLWGLSSNPPSLTSDEAALGYNAYSILKTGRDEHGEFLPVIFKSFGDWKPGLYVYLTVPFVAAFGLNEFSVRFVGALSGILAVWLMFLLTKKLFNSEKTGIISALILATLPWHIHFSRGAWEISLAFTLLLGGLILFFKRNFYIAALLFGLTYWAYQGAKLATSITLLGVFLIYFKDIIKINRNVLLKSAAILILLLTPIALSVLQGKGGRLEVFSVFSYPPLESFVNKTLSQENDGLTKESLIYKLYHSDTLHFKRGVLGRWLNYYSPEFLFFEGDKNPRHSAQNIGQLLLIHLPFLALGFLALSKLKTNKEALLIWFLLFTLSLPAALSRDSINAVRSFNMILPLTLMLALGGTWVWNKLQVVPKHMRPISFVLCTMFCALNLIYYLDSYWVHMPFKTSKDWGYGYKQIVENITPLRSTVNEVVIDQDYVQPYIYFLFYNVGISERSKYNKFDPTKYQKLSKENFIQNDQGDVGLVTTLDNISFREIYWVDDKYLKGKLFVIGTIFIPLSEYNDPTKFKVVKEIRYLDNQPAFTVIEVL